MLVPRLFSVPLVATATATAAVDISIIIMSDAIKAIYMYVCAYYKHTDNLATFVARARERRFHGGFRVYIILFSAGRVDGVQKK